MKKQNRIVKILLFIPAILLTVSGILLVLEVKWISSRLLFIFIMILMGLVTWLENKYLKNN
ncbi:hypothetical protein T190115A13A_150098 [Tenacibaculum sp. 190524A02b]|uniref:Phosphatidate cytidylyltransferase n=1 Tax=Tenacibaculum vairaonense TaxID=3137860 RepID=A0ABM9PIK8_9FLAO